MSFTLPALPYSFEALEPHIDAKTMEIHHDKHHQAYVDKLNAAVDSKPELKDKTIEELLTDINELPEDVRTAIRNNGGGHWNHTFFWEILSPNGLEPSGKIIEELDKAFGSFEKFKEEFTNAAIGRFGSGWAWLIKTDSGLAVVSTPNQDNPLMDIAEVKGKPLLVLDVWEHAYYLNYQNRRPDYVAAFWNIINWDKVAENLG